LSPTFFIGVPWLAAYVVSQALGGLYLGLAVAPNHKGMPTWTRQTRLSFLERQVLSSRNVRPGRVTDFVLGGLNYQIEHHLFPSMPRANLRHAQPLVHQFCLHHGIPYSQTSALGSYVQVLRHLHALGAPLRRAAHTPA